MKGFIAAIQFITILPWGRSESFDPPRMMPYFPLVGIALGGLLVMFDYRRREFMGPAGGIPAGCCLFSRPDRRFSYRRLG